MPPHAAAAVEARSRRAALPARVVRRAAGELLDNPRRFDVFPVKTIYPEATGKFGFVKSASYEDFR